MRKVILSMLCLSLFVLSSCRHDDPEPTTAQKILGKWRLQKAIDEYYQPVNSLQSTDEINGGPGDSVVFKSNNEVYTYSPTEGDDMTTYQILNETTIKIEDEIYEIRTLTPTELYLRQDHTEAAFNSRYVQRIYFVR